MFFLCSEYKSLISDMINQYFLPLDELTFLMAVFITQNFKILMSPFFAFVTCAFGVCTDFCVNVSFPFTGINAKECNCGSYGSCMFSFIRNCITVFPSGRTSLHSHQQCLDDPVCPHPHQHLVVVVFFLF